MISEHQLHAGPSTVLACTSGKAGHLSLLSNKLVFKEYSPSSPLNTWGVAETPAEVVLLGTVN